MNEPAEGSSPTVVPDPDDPQGFTMVVSGVPSSYVHLGDPTRLEFEYVRWAGDVIDVMAADGEPVHTVHIGGAGCTLARYVAATRPRSRQIVLDDDPAVIALAREAFGYSRRSGFRLREADGLAGLRPLDAGQFDLVIRDAFAGDTTPPHLTTTEFVGQAARVLATDGLYVANIADRPGLRLVRREVATALTRFTHVALVGETQHLRGRRYGNVLLVASRRALPVADLTRRVVSGPVPARVVPPSETRRLASGAEPITS
ncbi:spermidine synthase [Angustibacter sp. McL0619]|uniref:spermidine synthase n=1 Tax=Angustibacter sp. McL0619 TaxID=3415676 RepID=UPI003CEB3F1D